MAITNLQQARQLYAMGQRVAKTMDGSRPGYRGSDWGGSSYGDPADSSSSRGGTTSSSDDNRENYGASTQYSPPPAPQLSGGDGGIDPGFQNALRNQQIRQNTITQSQNPNFGQFFNTRIPTYQAPTFRNRMGSLGNAMAGGVLGLINPLAGLAFKGYNYFKDQVPRAFSNFKSTNTLEEFRDKMRGYGKTMPTYSNNPAFGGIESLGIDINDLVANRPDYNVGDISDKTFDAAIGSGFNPYTGEELKPGEAQELQDQRNNQSGINQLKFIV